MTTKKKYVYKFTAEHGAEDFPTLGCTLTKAGDLVESDVPIEHARLKLVGGEAKSKAKVKKEKVKKDKGKPEEISVSKEVPAPEEVKAPSEEGKE